jgi:hypothetical protein
LLNPCGRRHQSRSRRLQKEALMPVLYVIGDSFSAGSELCDNMLPSWPYYKNPKVDMEKFSEWLNSSEYTNDIAALNMTQDQFAELTLEKAYPAKLGKLIDYEVINRSVGNTGSIYWRYKVLEDLIQFQKHNKTIDYAIVNFTDVFRETFVQLDKSALHYKHISVSHTDPYKNASAYFKYKSLLQDDMSYVYHFLTDLYFIKSTLHTMGAKKVLFIMSMDLFWIKEFITSTHIVDLMKFIELDLNTLPILESCKVDRLLGGHFCEETHKLFAEQIAKEFFGK